MYLRSSLFRMLIFASVSVAALTVPISSIGSTGAALAAGRACSLPVTHDPYDGFHIGVPAGWDLFTLDGTIVVGSGAEEAIVYPVLQTNGLRPWAFFQAYMHTLKQRIAASGNAMTYRVTSHGNQLPTAVLNGRAGNAAVRGQAHVVRLPYRTAHGSALLAVTAYWAPTSRLAGQRTRLAAIGACYGPQRGTLYHVLRDQAFTYAMPLGWSVKQEDQNSISITKGNNAIALYALLGPQFTSAGVDSPQTWFHWALGKLGINVTRVLGSVRIGDQTESNGDVQGQEYVEFTGRLTSDGRAIHGIGYVVSNTGGGVSSAVLRLGVSTTGLWNSTNGALIHVIGSIQHNFAQDLQQWERVNQQWQQFDQQVQGFDDALNGVDLVRNPSTGQTYEAPYDAYNSSGPGGPGYYYDQGGIPTKLDIITP